MHVEWGKNGEWNRTQDLKSWEILEILPSFIFGSYQLQSLIIIAMQFTFLSCRSGKVCFILFSYSYHLFSSWKWENHGKSLRKHYFSAVFTHQQATAEQFGGKNGEWMDKNPKTPHLIGNRTLKIIFTSFPSFLMFSGKCCAATWKKKYFMYNLFWIFHHSEILSMTIASWEVVRVCMCVLKLETFIVSMNSLKMRVKALENQSRSLLYCFRLHESRILYPKFSI